MRHRVFASLVVACVLGSAPAVRAQDDSNGSPVGPPDAQSRLFFAPTARALPRGEGYFGLYDYVLPFAQYGLTDRLSIGGGVFPFPFEGTPIWLTPKLQVFSTRHVALATGVVHVMTPRESVGGVAYVVTTIGGRTTSVTANVGYAYNGFIAGNGQDDIIGMFGAEHRFSDRVAFMTENHVFPGGAFLFNGVSLQRGRNSWNVGLLIIAGNKGLGRLAAVPIGIPVWRW
jgi:hypothetical protein